ncbi:purine-binding chemotaxis protein CheW [Maridesulfovibrio ferrireducens]|uniref:Purine-binding chemotaxis protein CheW n=1 Tax=Maridesulfovibrio ferrireducens TaxID=246191 RepID=A0A1G9GVS6_9BACT|nr:chemotaxis protein CheW [Maridesulfovibrio ferrireducens]SDL04767.1 purine-binding chemotaxis protein CheW [Maridesulfovibrio ferrireducens]
MNEHDYVVFKVDSCKFAVSSSLVDKVELAVSLSPVPDAPYPVLGVVSDGGTIVPVVGVRRKIGNEERDVILSDRLLFSRLGNRKIAILADEVNDVIEIPPGMSQQSNQIWPGVFYLKSFAGMGEDIILVQDLNSILNSEQEKTLSEALEAFVKQGEIDTDD